MHVWISMHMRMYVYNVLHIISIHMCMHVHNVSYVHACPQRVVKRVVINVSVSKQMSCTPKKQTKTSLARDET